MSGGTRKRERDEETQMPENRQLNIVIDILQRRDTYEIFAQPVDAEEVEGYYEIVKEPMDFKTMRAKLNDGMYHSLDQFKNDVFLITSNAMQFNASSTIFYKQARGMQELAKKIFHTLVTDPENLESKFMAGTRRRSARIQHVNKSPMPSSRKPPPPVSHAQVPTKIRRNDSKLSEGEEFLAQDRRSTYITSLAGNERGRQQLVPSAELLINSCSYRESLLRFVSDLGPTAKMVAARKLSSLPSAEHQAQDGKKAEASTNFYENGMAAASANVNKNGKAAASANVYKNRKAAASTNVNEKGTEAASANVSARVLPVVLALECPKPKDYSKLKSRNKKQTNNDSNHTAAAMTPMQKLMEEEKKKPSTGAFTFDLGFLKAQLQKMNPPAKSTPPPP